MVDVVVPFFNAPAMLRRCLQALLHALKPEAGVVLVDDASGEQAGHMARTWCEARGGRSRYLRNAENRGFRHSVSMGIAASDAPAFVLLNSDTVPTPLFATRLDAVRRARPSCALVAPVSNNAADLFQYRETCAWNDGPFAPYMRETALQRAEDWRGQITPAPYLTAACLLVDRAAYDAAGGFSAAYRHGYFEDLDLCCRLRALGKEALIREDCFVYHEARGSYRWMEERQRSALMQENFAAFCARWAHLPEHAALLERLEAAGRAAAAQRHGDRA